MAQPYPTLIRRLAAIAGLLPAASLSLAQSQDAPVPTAVEVAQPKDDVVQMEAYNVSTSIGAYHEESSSMATKIPTSLKELASSLQILNANAITDRNALTLQDVYQYVIGLTQSQPNTNGFTFRGFPNSGNFEQNFETDGLQGGTLRKSGVSAANVESVEFLKGPNSVLYGQMHPGGLLNIVTKSPKAASEVYLHATVSTWAGAFNSFGSKNGYSGVVDATGPIDAAKHWLYRMIVDARNEPPYRDGDYARTLALYPSLTYQWSPQTYLTVKGDVSQDKRRADSGIIPIFTQGTAYGPNARWFTAPLNTVYDFPTDVGRDRGASVSSLFHTQFADLWTLRIQTRTTWHTDGGRGLGPAAAGFVPAGTFATPATTIRPQYGNNKNGHRYNFFDANFYGTVGPDSFRNTVLVGIGGGQEYYSNFKIGSGPLVSPAITLFNPIVGQSAYPPDGTSTSNVRNTLTNFGEYASDQMKVGDSVHVTFGLRHDQQVSHGIDIVNPTRSPYVHQSVSAVTAQFGAVYDLTANLSAYASASQSVVPNNVTSIDATGQSGFPPEKGLQYEGGLKFETPDHKVYASLAAYFIKRTNVLVGAGIVLPVTNQPIFRLDGEQHSEGFEFETQWQPFPYWQVQAGLALSKAFVAISVKNPQTVGLDLANAPRGSANFWSRYNVPRGPLKGLGIGVGAVYVGKQWGGDPSSTTYFPVPGWTRIDSSLFYKWRRYEFSLSMGNVFDRRYYLAAFSAILLIPGDERKLTLSASTRF